MLRRRAPDAERKGLTMDRDHEKYYDGEEMDVQETATPRREDEVNDMRYFIRIIVHIAEK